MGHKLVNAYYRTKRWVKQNKLMAIGSLLLVITSVLDAVVTARHALTSQTHVEINPIIRFTLKHGVLNMYAFKGVFMLAVIALAIKTQSAKYLFIPAAIYLLGAISWYL